MKKIIFLALLAVIAVGCGKRTAELERDLQVRDSLYNDAVQKMTTLRSDLVEANNVITILTGKMDTLKIVVDTLQKDTTTLRAEIACLKAKMVRYRLTPDCADEVKKATAKPAPKPVAKPAPKKAAAPCPPVVKTPEPPAPVVSRSIVKEAEQTVSVLDKFVGNAEFGEFVLQINDLEGGHFPHLAMMKGHKFTNQEVVSNYMGNGYNFKIIKMTKGFTDVFGLTEDGVLYVKTSLVSQAYKWTVKSAGMRFTGHWHENVQCTVMNDQYGTVYGVNILPFLK